MDDFTDLVTSYLNEISLVWITTSPAQIKKGIPNILIFEPKSHYNGLALTLTEDDGYVCLKSMRWFKRLHMKNWHCRCCSTFEEVEEVVNQYMNNVQRPI